MYTHKPILSVMTVIMPLVGIYLFFCGPKKRDTVKRRRPLRSYQRHRQRQEKNEETIPVTTSESQVRRRTKDRTSDSNTEDLHED